MRDARAKIAGELPILGGGRLDECAQAHGAGQKVGSTAQRTAPAHQPRQHVVPTTGGRASANGVAESRAWVDRGHLAGCLGVTWAACTFCPGGACSVCRARNRGLQHAICSAPLPLVPSSLGCAEFQPPQRWPGDPGDPPLHCGTLRLPRNARARRRTTGTSSTPSAPRPPKGGTSRVSTVPTCPRRDP